MSNNKTDYIDYRCPLPCGGLLCRYKDHNKPWAFEIKCYRHKCRSMNYRGNVIMQSPVEFRCQAVDKKRSEKWNKTVICNKLLARIVPGTILEIKCPRCGSIQTSEHITNEGQNHE